MRRILLTLVLALAWAVPASAQIAITLTGTADNAAYTASVKTYTGLGTLTTGNFVVCGVMNQNNRSFSSVAIGGQAMTQIATSLITNKQAIYYRVVTGAESNSTVVVTLSGGDTNPSMMNCLEASGVSSDQSGATGDGDDDASALSHSVGPLTPATAHNLVVKYSGQRANRPWTDDAGWTDVGATDQTWSFGYDIQTAADARTWTSSNVDSNGGQAQSMVAFSGNAGGSGCTGGLLLLGAGKC